LCITKQKEASSLMIVPKFVYYKTQRSVFSNDCPQIVVL